MHFEWLLWLSIGILWWTCSKYSIDVLFQKKINSRAITWPTLSLSLSSIWNGQILSLAFTPITIYILHRKIPLDLSNNETLFKMNVCPAKVSLSTVILTTERGSQCSIHIIFISKVYSYNFRQLAKHFFYLYILRINTKYLPTYLLAFYILSSK